MSARFGGARRGSTTTNSHAGDALPDYRREATRKGAAAAAVVLVAVIIGAAYALLASGLLFRICEALEIGPNQ